MTRAFGQCASREVTALLASCKGTPLRGFGLAITKHLTETSRVSEQSRAWPRNDLPEPSNGKKETMKKQRMPPGWTQKQIRELARYHDNMTEDEQAAEIEAAAKAKNVTMVPVPNDLLPQVLALIKRGKRPA